MPDSVTSWNVWVHAITRDLRAGSVNARRSVKELMVRPYVPRFLREGDEAELKVVVNNAGAKALSGRSRSTSRPRDEEEPPRRVRPPGGGRDAPFAVRPGGGTNLTFPRHGAAA